MKKQLLFAGMLLVFGAVFQSCFCAVNAEENPDEALINGLLQKITVPTLVFEGNNPNWTCTYQIMEPVLKTKETEVKVRSIFTLMAKSVASVNQKFGYFAQTSKGWIAGEQYLQPDQSIIVESNATVPNAYENIYVEIGSMNGTKEKLILTNPIPINAITREQAFRTFFKVFYNSYKAYPTANFSYQLAFQDRRYWLITFDDNDGIGGKSRLLIDALTGQPSEMKEDE